MNYYNPYFMGIPSGIGRMATPATGGLFSRLLGRGFNLSSIITNTQKTLGVVNQAIPLIKQANPVIKNARTMFKVMNEFKKVDTPTSKKNVGNKVNNNIKQENNEISTDTNGPTFFL